MMYRLERYDYSPNPKEDAVMKEVMESNLSDETKLALMALMSGYMSKKDEVDTAVREHLLEAFMRFDKPVQLKEMLYDEENPHFVPELEVFTHQRVKAQVRFLVGAGLVERSEEYTGRTIRVNKTKEVPEVVVKFRIVK